MSKNLKTALLAGAAIVTLGASGAMAKDYNADNGYQYPNNFASEERTAGMNENEHNYNVNETREQPNQLDLEVQAKANSGINEELSADRIEDAQAALRDEGYTIMVDGIIGPETRSAIRSFQTSNNIEATGNLTPKTLEALEVSMNTTPPFDKTR